MAKKTDNPFKSGLNQRQETIVKYIGSAGRAKISDFLDKFAGISSKTIQRDLNDLVVKNILKKEGEKRWTVYSLV
jgi:DeoR/GlpR family transcriptional regulator of sugar metabolism